MSGSSEGIQASQQGASARLFFALWPDTAMQMALAESAEATLREAEKTDPGVRRVPATNLHLTLAFLGSVALSRLAAVDEAARRCARTHHLGGAPIELVLDSIEYWRKAQVLCATGETPVAAVKLAELLTLALTETGFSPDLKKPFRAHVTLARKARRATRQTRLEPQMWTFRTFALVHSRTSPAGSEYTVVTTYALL